MRLVELHTVNDKVVHVNLDSIAAINDAAAQMFVPDGVGSILWFTDPFVNGGLYVRESVDDVLRLIDPPPVPPRERPPEPEYEELDPKDWPRVQPSD